MRAIARLNSDVRLGAIGLKPEESAICVASLLSKLLLDYVIPRRLRVPSGLIVSATFVWLTAKAGATSESQALKVRSMPRGLLFGLAASVPIIAFVSAGLLTRASRGLFEHTRIESKTLSDLAYELLVRIPFGTALHEEVIFRGAVLGLLTRHHCALKSAIVSSVIFGLWHIVPALQNARAGRDFHKSAWVGASLPTTILAGLFFSWLRFRSQSVVAPWIAHTAANTSAYSAVWIRGRQKEAHTQARCRGYGHSGRFPSLYRTGCAALDHAQNGEQSIGQC